MGRKAKKIDPRQDPLGYMDTLPEKRRVCHCEKHVFFQPDCAPCVALWTEWWDQRDEWHKNHKYRSDENYKITYHGQSKAEAERRAKAAQE